MKMIFRMSFIGRAQNFPCAEMASFASAQSINRRSRQSGLGLIEIMVALAIGVFMLTGILSLVVWVSQTRVELDKTSEQIENGRYAVQLLSEDLRLAGFYGTSQIVASNYSMPDLCATAATLSNLELTYDTALPGATLPVPVYGYAAGSTLPTCLSNAVPGSEALVIHRVGTADVAPAAITANTPYVQMSGCATDTQPMIFGKASGTFVLRKKDCATLATVWPYTVRTYYLSNCDECSPSDGIPTLKMAELVGSSIQVTPLVEGIEDIHFEYGFDLDANGAPDCFAADPADDTAPADCPAGWSTTDSVNWSNITSVRVHLLARSIDATGSWTDNRTYDLGRAARSGPFDDHYKRQVYSTVLAIPNVGGVRE